MPSLANVVLAEYAFFFKEDIHANSRASVLPSSLDIGALAEFLHSLVSCNPLVSISSSIECEPFHNDTVTIVCSIRPT